VSRRLLLSLAALLAIFSLTIYVTGGFVTSVGGLRVSSRSPTASAGAAAVALLAWIYFARRARAVHQDLARADAWLLSHASKIVVTIAGLAGAVAAYYASYSAAGSDASGYLSQAVMLSQGHLTHAEPLTTFAAWRDSAMTLAPLGWRPGMVPGVQVPTYAVGLPLLLAPVHAIGGIIAASMIPPAALAVAVWAMGAFASRVAGPAAAIVASVWLATSPIALIEAMQPMSDVPVTAAWLVCWLLITRNENIHGLREMSVCLGAGVATALAVLIRPNLAPLAALPALYVLSGTGEGGIRRSVVRFAAFSAPVAVAGVVVAYLHWRYFGSALRSGYGTVGEIYAMSNLAPNATLYARWLLETHGPWLLLAPLAAFVPGGRTIRWLLAFAALVVIPYLLYSVFEVWTYLRFLLPALAILMVAAASVVATALARLPHVMRTPVLVALLLGLAATNIASARSHGVFRFAGSQSRAALAGRYLDRSLPAASVVIAGEQSGSIRYYTGRSIVRWDFLAADSLNPSIETLAESGYDV
jgi:hypothetical protein